MSSSSTNRRRTWTMRLRTESSTTCAGTSSHAPWSWSLTTAVSSPRTTPSSTSANDRRALRPQDRSVSLRTEHDLVPARDRGTGVLLRLRLRLLRRGAFPVRIIADTGLVEQRELILVIEDADLLRRLLRILGGRGGAYECEARVIGRRRRLPRLGVTTLPVSLALLGHRTQTGPRLLLRMTALAQVLENATGLGLMVTCLLRRSRPSGLTGRRLGGGGIGGGLGREDIDFLGVPPPFATAAVVPDRAAVGRARAGQPISTTVH